MSSRFTFSALSRHARNQVKTALHKRSFSSSPGMPPVPGETEVRSVMYLPNGNKVELKGYSAEDIQWVQDEIRKISNGVPKEAKRLFDWQSFILKVIGIGIGTTCANYVVDSLNKKKAEKNGGGTDDTSEGRDGELVDLEA